MATPITRFQVTVSGKAEIPHPAERAKINIVVSSSGKIKAAVSDQVITAAKHTETLLRELSPIDDSVEAKKAAAIAHWSKTSLSSTSYVPYSSKGTEVARNYDSRVTFDIRFKDFAALGVFSTKVSSMSHVEIQNIEWILTAATERSYRSELRREAAKVALRKAQDYCEVLGCTNIRPVELEEGKALTRSATKNWNPYMAMAAQQSANVSYQQAQSAPGMAMASQMGSAANNYNRRAENDLEFTPQEIRMSMEVTVLFHAE